MSKLKKRNRVIIGLSILIIFVIILWNNSRNPEFSVHDLNWEDTIGMNERISYATFSDPPWLYDGQVHGLGHLNILLSFFADNLDYIRDTPEEEDLSIKLYFTGLTGGELFLENINSNIWGGSNNFELKFYFDRGLSIGFFDALNASGQVRFAYENPGLVDVGILFEEIEWDYIMENYDAQISGFIIAAWVLEDEELRGHFSFYADSLYGDEIHLIVKFFFDNQDEIAMIRPEYRRNIISFRSGSDQEPRRFSNFGMTENLILRLIEVVGYDTWQEARLQD